MEIICIHGETGRNEPNWGNLLVGRRATAGLENNSIQWFHPQSDIIYSYKKCVSFFSVVLSIHLSLNFSYAILPSYHFKLNLFLVVSEIKCKNGEGEIFLEIILFEYNYVKMALNLKGMGF